jgi:HTH-type transcriptional regulator/antitoxin HigA
MSKQRKNFANELIPGDIFHPGEHLKDEIDAREISQQDLAEATDLSKSEISSIVHGRRKITPKIAFKLELALGVKAEFWMNLQIKYDIDLIKREYSKNLEKAKLSPTLRTRMKKLITSV